MECTQICQDLERKVTAKEGVLSSEQSAGANVECIVDQYTGKWPHRYSQLSLTEAELTRYSAPD